MLPAMLAANLALGASCLAVAVRSKDKVLKQEAAASGISAIFAGVTEPGLYGVMLPQKKPLFAVAVACFVSGLIGGIARVAASAFASPSLLSITIFVHGEGFSNFVWAVVMAAVSLLVSFLLTLLLPEFSALGKRLFKRGRGEMTDKNEETVEAAEAPAETPVEREIAAPLSGRLVSLAEVRTRPFRKECWASARPFSLRRERYLRPSTAGRKPVMGHALGLRSAGGIELLIHVGLETVKLRGKHFVPHVAEGDVFRKGDLLLEFDPDAIAREGYPTVTPVVVTNAGECGTVLPVSPREITAGERMISVTREGMREGTERKK